MGELAHRVRALEQRVLALVLALAMESVLALALDRRFPVSSMGTLKSRPYQLRHPPPLLLRLLLLLLPLRLLLLLLLPLQHRLLRLLLLRLLLWLLLLRLLSAV
jgi:hypothetical protein